MVRFLFTAETQRTQSWRKELQIRELRILTFFRLILLSLLCQSREIASLKQNCDTLSTLRPLYFFLIKYNFEES